MSGTELLAPLLGALAERRRPGDGAEPLQDGAGVERSPGRFQAAGLRPSYPAARLCQPSDRTGRDAQSPPEADGTRYLGLTLIPTAICGPTSVPIAPVPALSRPRSSHSVFPVAAASAAPVGARECENKIWRKRTAANEACLDPLLWHPRGTLRNSAGLGWLVKPRKTLAFLDSFRKPLKTGFCQRPVGLRSLLMPDFVGFCSGAQGQNRTGDTRIFNPLLYRLSYLGRRQWRKAGFLEEAPAPVQRCLTGGPDAREAPNFSELSSSSGYRAWSVFAGLGAGDHIAALEPAGEIDVGAAARAEGAELCAALGLPQIGQASGAADIEDLLRPRRYSKRTRPAPRRAQRPRTPGLAWAANQSATGRRGGHQKFGAWAIGGGLALDHGAASPAP